MKKTIEKNLKKKRKKKSNAKKPILDTGNIELDFGIDQFNQEMDKMNKGINEELGRFHKQRSK